MSDDADVNMQTAEPDTKAAPSGAVSVSGDGDQRPTNAAGGADVSAAKADAGGRGGTLADGGDVGDKQAAVPVDFPEDWRQKLAGDNKDDLKTLNRYSSPQGVWNALKALRAKLSAGELKAIREFPADGDEKEQAAWRKEHGVPETPDGYELKVEGLVFGDADKPMLDSFRQHAHTKNWTPEQFNQALEWYAQEQEKLIAQRDESDDRFRSEARDKLYAEWGPQDFRRNINAIQNLFAGAPESLRDRILGARLADGRLAGDDPDFLRFFAQLAREVNPAATLVPASGGDTKSIDSRIAELEKMMGNRGSDYWRGPKAEALQAEYRELITAREKLKSRAA